MQTASNRLRKLIIWNFVTKYGEDTCFQCGEKITSIDDLSIEHKVPWMYSGREQELYFDLDNVTFSHISCNKGAARKTYAKCGTKSAYNRGCRCTECTTANRHYTRQQRKT